MLKHRLGLAQPHCPERNLKRRPAIVDKAAAVNQGH